MSDVHAAIIGVVREALDDAAEKEIEKHVKQFRDHLNEVKGDMIGKLVNCLEVMHTQDGFGNLTFQINIRK